MSDLATYYYEMNLRIEKKLKTKLYKIKRHQEYLRNEFNLDVTKGMTLLTLEDKSNE